MYIRKEPPWIRWLPRRRRKRMVPGSIQLLGFSSGQKINCNFQTRPRCMTGHLPLLGGYCQRYTSVLSWEWFTNRSFNAIETEVKHWFYGPWRLEKELNHFLLVNKERCLRLAQNLPSRACRSVNAQHLSSLWTVFDIWYPAHWTVNPWLSPQVWSKSHQG